MKATIVLNWAPAHAASSTMAINIPDVLARPRQIMDEELVEEHGAAAIESDMRQALHQHLTNLDDNHQAD